MRTTARLIVNLAKKRSRMERLTWLPVIAALAAIWILATILTLSERKFTLERVESQLATAVTTLADFNELAEQATGDAIVRSADHRAAAIWRALLQYPTASIWIVSDAEVTGGTPPVDSAEDAIVVEDSRAGFTVHAALPRADALVDWQRSAWKLGIALLLASSAFILLSTFLIRALRQRTDAEQEAVKQSERAAALARYQTQLEETVAARTGELKESNELLENELVVRKATETQLKEHDALLHAVTKSAAELLSSRSLEDATTSVLALIGQTVAVSRIHVNTIRTGPKGHLLSSVSNEWCAPDMTSMAGNAHLQRLDLTTVLPHVVGPLLGGRLSSFSAEDLSSDLQAVAKKAGMRSFLQIPINVNDKLWGSITFIDSGKTKRQWSWAETDTLQTLTGLFGVAIAQEKYVKELADANMIVQNSPTILYRLKGEPPFPLVYVSHNIRKFGHDAKQLVESTNWASVMMDKDDEAKIAAAMARTVEKNAQGASIEFRLRTGDGSYRWVENRYTTVRDKNNRLLEIEGMIIDITERKAAEDKIAQLARTDSLTGLANRGTFIERLRQAFSSTKRGGNAFAVLYLDMDHFKTINDTLGHQTGDLLLREMADRLKSCARDNDVVARLGGDEFAVLQTDINEPENAGTLAATILTSLTRPYLLGGNDLHVTVSIGICPYGPDSAGPESMLAQADLALYRSKEEGRNRYRFHTDDLDDQVLERMKLADQLRSAIEDGELELYYQPQVELASGRIVGMEALVRWHHPTRGLLPASEFIAVAEKTGAIIALGQWVLDNACAQWRSWHDTGIDPGVLTINVSFAQLKSSHELLRSVKTTLEKWHLEPSDIGFDVTEATLAKATLIHSDILADLRALGVRITIADFGGEYSTLNYLRTYRVSHLKIAQSFIDASASDAERKTMMQAIVNLADELDIGVISQGVETAVQRDLSNETSTIAQGLFFAEAMDAADVTGLLRVGSIDVAGGASAEPASETTDEPAAQAPVASSKR